MSEVKRLAYNPDKLTLHPGIHLEPPLFLRFKRMVKTITDEYDESQLGKGLNSIKGRLELTELILREREKLGRSLARLPEILAFESDLDLNIEDASEAPYEIVELPSEIKNTLTQSIRAFNPMRHGSHRPNFSILFGPDSQIPILTGIDDIGVVAEKIYDWSLKNGVLRKVAWGLVKETSGDERHESGEAFIRTRDERKLVIKTLGLKITGEDIERISPS